METDPHANLDRELDHYVDTAQGSYADGWERSGVAMPDNDDFTATAIRDRCEGLAFDDLPESTLSDDDTKPLRGSYKSGPNQASWERQSELQHRLNAAGAEAARSALRGK